MVAAKWYGLAAERGQVDSQFNLALMLERGEGIAQNDALAEKWFKRAAEQGDVEAQAQLASMYALGGARPKNLEAAYYWISLAALQKSEYAELRDLTEKRLKPAQIKAVKARAAAWKPRPEHP